MMFMEVYDQAHGAQIHVRRVPFSSITKTTIIAQNKVHHLGDFFNSPKVQKGTSVTLNCRAAVF